MDRANIQESRRFLSSDKSAFYTFLSKKIHKFEEFTGKNRQKNIYIYSCKNQTVL